MRSRSPIMQVFKFYSLYIFQYQRNQPMSNFSQDQEAILADDDLQEAEHNKLQPADTESMSYSHLMNELKMKSSALAKASHLIEILQIELEVERNSRNEAVLAAQQEMRDHYESQIHAMNAKIASLELDETRKRRSVVFHSEKNASLEKSRSSSRVLKKSCSGFMKRSSSRDNLSTHSNKAAPEAEEAGWSARYYRLLLEQRSISQERLNQQYKQILTLEEQHFEEVLHAYAVNEQQADKLLAVPGNKDHKQQDRLEIVEQVIRKLMAVVEEMKIYQMQLEEILDAVATKLGNLFNERQGRIQKPATLQIASPIQQILVLVKQHRQARASKQTKLLAENKELRDIIEEMIALMNKKNGSHKGPRSMIH